MEGCAGGGQSLIDASLLDAHEQATARFTALVASMPVEPRPVPRLEWSSIEVAAHVLSVLRGYQRLAIENTPLWANQHDGPSENQRLLDATPERSPVTLATEIAAEAPRMRAALQACDRDLAAWGNIAIPAATVLAVNLGDVLLHGFDISRALGRPWAIDTADAIRVIDATTDLLPGFVNAETARGLTVTYALTIRRGPCYALAFNDATLTVHPGRPARADCRILGSAVPFMLTSWGRRSPVHSALRAHVIAYGRKPWLAFRFTKLLLPP